jgi:hypothetical protein
MLSTSVFASQAAGGGSVSAMRAPAAVSKYPSTLKPSKPKI